VQTLIFSSIAVALTCGAASARAQTGLSDPMRPQAFALTEDAAELPSSRLQSILISPGRKVAVIDGKTVPLGGAVGDATLIAIRESEVVLQKGAERETLMFNQNVQVKPVPRLAPAKATK
jgi:MSHA biogenesis protein MshK